MLRRWSTSSFGSHKASPPWHLKHQEKKKEEDDQAASDFSSRKQAFNATWLKGSIAEVVFK